MPTKMKDFRTQLIQGLVSERFYILGYCVSCIYDEHSNLGPWKAQVKQCHIEDCPLFKAKDFQIELWENR